MSAAAVTLTVRRDPVFRDSFLISLTGFHYEGEGRIVDRYDLERVLGAAATEILEAELKQENAA